MSQNEPNAPQRKPGALQWFYYQGWKLILVIVLLLILASGLTVNNLSRRYDSDLKAIKAKGQPITAAELAGPKLPDNQNGAIEFAKAFKLLEKKEQKAACDLLAKMLSSERIGADRKKYPPVPWSDARLAVKRLSGMVPLTQQALSRPGCQFPVNWAAGSGALYPHLGGLRAVVKALCAEAVVDAHDGRMNDAYQKIDLAFRSTKTINNEPTLIGLMVSVACTEIANSGLVTVLKYGQPRVLQQAELNRFLTDTNLDRSLIPAMIGERAIGLTQFSKMINGDLASYLDALPGGRSGTEMTRDDRSNLRGFGSIARPFICLDGIAYMRMMGESIAIAGNDELSIKQKQDAMAKVEQTIPRYAVMTSLMYPVFTQAVSRPHTTRARNALTQILLAAQQYKASHGQYPESMAQVRSVGIADIPMDPFSSKDFIYKRTAKGFTVYSVGEDFKDDGGRQMKYGVNHDKGGDYVLNWER